MRIGVIGTGTIASAVVEGIAGDGHVITVSRRSAARSAALAARYDCVEAAENQTVVDRSDVVLLGLMAEHAEAVLSAIRFREGQRVISLMAGVTLEAVAALVAPARAEAIMIPFPGISQGGSPVLVRGGGALVRDLFGAHNTVFEIDSDAALEAFMCAQAVLSPAVKMVDTAAEWMAEAGTDRALAEAFLRLLVGSSLIGSETGAMLAALDTPGGYNQRLRRHMVDAGMDSDLRAGLDKLAQKT